jgi:hypothetical protein
VVADSDIANNLNGRAPRRNANFVSFEQSVAA